MTVIPLFCCIGNFKRIGFVPDFTKAWCKTVVEVVGGLSLFLVWGQGVYTFFFLFDCSRICSLNLVNPIYKNPQSGERGMWYKGLVCTLVFPGIDMMTWEGVRRRTEPERTKLAVIFFIEPQDKFH